VLRILSRAEGMTSDYYIGTSGWHYNHWRGPFYPQKLPPKEWLEFYAQKFNTVEINASFYRLPQEKTFDAWLKAVPSGFCFAVKVSRFITHIKHLKDSQEPLRTFLDRAKHLDRSLGPLLYQLPAGFHRDDDRLEEFLKSLDKRFKHVFEFRHLSWMDETVFKLLYKYQVGFCIFDMPGFTSPVVATSNFAYLRFHGHDDLYSSRYPEAELADWAGKLLKLSSAVQIIYIYFNNDAGGYAIENALTIRKYLEEQ
jgi:uncharacterized protein YecE (DUF72 family)